MSLFLLLCPHDYFFGWIGKGDQTFFTKLLSENFNEIVVLINLCKYDGQIAIGNALFWFMNVVNW